MARFLNSIVVLLVLMPLGLAAGAAHAEKRIALVIGNAGYQAGALSTPANDAGLIAQTLQASGFDVVGARDLDQDSLRRAFHDFLDKASASGPDTVAFVYLSGYGLQLEGENYFVPIDAKIARDTDVPAEAVRVSDYTRPLAALKLKASIVVLDAARVNLFARSGQPLAGGLALVEPEPGMLIAFNAAPGTVAPEGKGPYGPYAQALAEMMREGGLPLPDVFERTRLRVNDTTKGGEVPWHASRVQTPVVFFERAADAPAPAASAEATAAIRSRAIRDLDAHQAYLEALDRDTLPGYLDFLAAYPDDPMAKRVRAIVAARREAIVWRHTRVVDTPEAYWSYLRRYPRGPHAADARRRLAFLAAAFEPPPSFSLIEYDVPPPPPDEIVYVERPVLIFDDPYYDFPPPPPLLVVFVPPPPPEFIFLPPPPPPFAVFVLPIPVYVPVPLWCRPPAYVAPPPNNVIFANVHNTVVINNTTNVVTITNPAGQTKTLSPPAPSAAAPGGQVAKPTAASMLAPALPPSVAQKAITIQNQTSPGGGNQPGQSGQTSSQPGQPAKQPLGQQLPGTNAKPLPPGPSVPNTAGAQTKQPMTQQPGQPPKQPLGQPLPGTSAKPLPPVPGASNTGGAQTKQPTTGQPNPPSGQPLGQPSPEPKVKPLPPVGSAPKTGGAQTNQPTQQQIRQQDQQRLQRQIQQQDQQRQQQQIRQQDQQHLQRQIQQQDQQRLQRQIQQQDQQRQQQQIRQQDQQRLQRQIQQQDQQRQQIQQQGQQRLQQEIRRPQPPPPVVSRPSSPPPVVSRPSPPPSPQVARPSPPPGQGKPADCGGPGKPPCGR